MGLTVDASRRVWAVEREGAVAVLDDEGRPVRTLKASGEASLNLGPPSAPHDGAIWVPSNEGLYAIDTATFAIRNIRHDAMRSISLPQDDVTAVHIDRGGLLWSGSDSAMSYADLDPRQAFGISAVFASQAGDAHATPSVVREGPAGALWLGRNNASLQRLDRLTGKLSTATTRPGVPAPRSVGSIAFASDGRMLVAGSNGLFEVGGDAVVRRRLLSSPVRRLLADGESLYVGDAQGVGRMDLARPSAVEALPGLPSGPGQQVNALARSSSGMIWVGTIHGLYRFDPRTRLAAHVRDAKTGGAEAKGPRLDSQYITSIRVDRAGRVWAGSIGNLFLISDADGAHPRVRRLGVADGLPNPNIDSILEAQDGAIWVSTDKGIARIDPVSLHIRRLSEAEGVAFANNWADGGDVLASGELVFAGVGGLTFVDPRFDAKPPAPAVMLTDVRVGERLASPAIDRVDIAPGAGALSVSFASPDLAAADRIGFAYRLDGLDKTWTRVAPNRRSAEFTHLPPGTYTLEVQATDRQGALGGVPRRLEVVVHPSLTQTWWFRAGLCLIALGAGCGALALRNRAQKRRQAHLESLVERRTSELRSSQAELERLAYFDPLTGLSNRRMFQELLGGLMKSDRGAPFALVVGDLDRFKTINDTLGHDAGDELLSQVAARLASAVRARDSVCRLGGDEFALLIQDVETPQEIGALCERILSALAEPVFFQGRAMQTGLSLGVALYPRQSRTPVELYKLADTALYAAKAAGRGTWRVAGARSPADA